jgi:hypothetical protein
MVRDGALHAPQRRLDGTHTMAYAQATIQQGKQAQRQNPIRIRRPARWAGVRTCRLQKAAGLRNGAAGRKCGPAGPRVPTKQPSWLLDTISHLGSQRAGTTGRRHASRPPLDPKPRTTAELQTACGLKHAASLSPHQLRRRRRARRCCRTSRCLGPTGCASRPQTRCPPTPAPL